MAEATCTWTGISGRDYTFHVFAMDKLIEQGAKGNYIYAKLEPDKTWRPIYVGHGNLTARCTDCPHQMECIKKMGATHVHVRFTAGGEETHGAVARDLLARYFEAYAPFGCTERPRERRAGDRVSSNSRDRRTNARAGERQIDGHD